MDAGLPDALSLTRRVYEALDHRSAERSLFGYVIAKLIVRKSRLGLSPFQGLNVEEVYDALKRFIARDTDVLTEFVYSWDPITSPSRASFQSDQFARLIGSAFSLREGLNHIAVAPDNSRLRAAGELISHALEPIALRGDITQTLRPYLEVLVNCISLPEAKHKYLSQLTSYAEAHAIGVATLNYDTLVEQSCKQGGLKFDYGLSRWNERKYVRFSGVGMKLIKLHGSINWFEEDDNVLIDPEMPRYHKRAMIFGGQNDKLVPHGPYLQLRHSFQSLLRQTNVLGIVGYSFQDIHLNAIIRAWTSSKLRAKMVILDPSLPRLGHDVLGKFYTQDRRGQRKYTVEIDHIDATAAEGMDRFLKSLAKAPNPKPPAAITISPIPVR